MGNKHYRNLDSNYYIRRQPRKNRKKVRVIYGAASLVIVLLAGVFIFSLISKTVKSDNEGDLSSMKEEIPAEDLEAQQAAEQEAAAAEAEAQAQAQAEEAAKAALSPEVASFNLGYEVTTAENVSEIVSDEVISENAVLIDVDSGEIIARKAADTVISPASMTKILTVLVAAEHVTNLDDTFTITRDITDYAYSNDCSIVGFEVDEVVTVRDLMYGTILPSGADAGVGLAEYVAGSHEAFVDMMNQKLEELGLSDTAHFTNCVGLYDENHYCTLTDMAMILKAAVENDLAREVLSAHSYTTSPTAQHPEGLTISNWFLRRIEDKETNGEVLCAKTGFVNQSGCCAASYSISNSGGHYICVSANAWSSWRCIYDQVEIYKQYLS